MWSSLKRIKFEFNLTNFPRSCWALRGSISNVLLSRPFHHFPSGSCSGKLYRDGSKRLWNCCMIPFMWHASARAMQTIYELLSTGVVKSRTVEPQVPHLDVDVRYDKSETSFVVSHAHLAESCLRCTTACDEWQIAVGRHAHWWFLVAFTVITCDIASPNDHDSCDCRTCSGWCANNWWSCHNS